MAKLTNITQKELANIPDGKLTSMRDLNAKALNLTGELIKAISDEAKNKSLAKPIAEVEQHQSHGRKK